MKIMGQEIFPDRPPIYYRPGTSDEAILGAFMQGNLTGNKEYLFPDINPKIIADVGANIGVASVWLANRYPNAQIFSYEPVPENYQLLKRNTSEYPTVHVFGYGLAEKNGPLTLFHSDCPDNFGGFSAYEIGSDTAQTIVCEMQGVAATFDRIGPVDFLKIDCEGAEWEIITSLKTQQLQDLRWITGEMHGVQDLALLQFLEGQGFHVAMSKNLGTRVYPFLAARPIISG